MQELQEFRPDAPAIAVLVVDDLAAHRATLCRRLQVLSYAVVAVSTGEEALHLIAHAPPDIVLLDYMMPHMDGIEVLERLRANAATRGLPVIMVTARAESDAATHALGKGASAYVTKPVDYNALKSLIDSLVSRARTGGANHGAISNPT